MWHIITTFLLEQREDVIGAANNQNFIAGLTVPFSSAHTLRMNHMIDSAIRLLDVAARFRSRNFPMIRVPIRGSSSAERRFRGSHFQCAVKRLATGQVPSHRLRISRPPLYRSPLCAIIQSDVSPRLCSGALGEN